MITLKQQSLLALIISGALFSSANSFGGNDNSFDWPTTRYYTGAAIAGVAGGALAHGNIILNIFYPAIFHWGINYGSTPTKEQRTNARFIRGAGSAVMTGAIYRNIPSRTAKTAIVLISGAAATFYDSQT